MTELALAVSSADQTSSKLWLFWETKQDGTAARNQSRERDELCSAVTFNCYDVKVIMGSASIAVAACGPWSLPQCFTLQERSFERAA